MHPVNAPCKCCLLYNEHVVVVDAVLNTVSLVKVHVSVGLVHGPWISWELSCGTVPNHADRARLSEFMKPHAGLLPPGGQRLLRQHSRESF